MFDDFLMFTLVRRTRMWFAREDIAYDLQIMNAGDSATKIREHFWYHARSKVAYPP